MPVSTVQAAKRAFVRVLLDLARRYRVKVVVNRDSLDKEVEAAYRRIVLQAHPDKGGATAHVSQLNKARDDWADAKKAQNSDGSQPRQQPSERSCFGVATPKTAFRVHSAAVLLTYSSITGMEHWEEFIKFVRGKL